MASNNWHSRIQRHKILVNNFNYLSLLQVFQLVLPLITYPYLIRVLGTELYGVVALANAIIIYFNVFIDFGFSISEIREISVSRHDHQKVSELVSAVIFIKLVFVLVALGVLLVLIHNLPGFNQHKWLYYASAGLLLDTAINPRFYFQAIEKMKFITLLNVVARLLFLIMIFLLVNAPGDYVLVPLMTSIGAVISSVAGLIIIFGRYGVRYVQPSLATIKGTIQNSLPFFGSRVSVLAINKTNVILIGSFLGYNQVAYYDLAEKLVSVMKMPFNIFNQVLFPNVSKTKNVQLVIKTLKGLLLVYMAGYGILHLTGASIVELVAGVEMLPALTVLYILGLSAITELVSVFLGAPALLAMGYKRQYNGSIIWGSLFYGSLVLLLWLFNGIELNMLALATVTASAFIMVYRIYYCRKYKLI